MIAFLHSGRFSLHSITDVRGYQTLEEFQNMSTTSFGMNVSAPTAFAQFLEVCAGLRHVLSQVLHHFRIAAVGDVVGKAVCEVFSAVRFGIVSQRRGGSFCTKELFMLCRESQHPIEKMSEFVERREKQG